MDKLERIYRRTEAGQRAWESEDPAISREHRRILGLLEDEMRWDEMRKVLRRHADILRLEELEIDGLVCHEVAPAGADLEVTGSFAFG